MVGPRPSTSSGAGEPRGLDVYACPTCGGSLSFEAASGEGQLACRNGHRFPVRGGLPRFVSDEGYAGSFGYQWTHYARSQRDGHTGTTISRDRLLRGTGWPEQMPGETILEAGCGSGRFTEVLLATGATVTAFDYSVAADVTFADFGDRATVCQASLFEMPYRPASFDRVFCYGVIQHTPDVAGAFAKLAEMVRPGGHLAVDVYDRLRMWFNARYRVRWLTRRLPREQLHEFLRVVVTAYFKYAPPLHPWHQLVLPIKDYRGALPGLAPEQVLEFSILDTLDALSPEHDDPQYVRTMRRLCARAGLCDVDVRRGGNGIEVRARRPG